MVPLTAFPQPHPAAGLPAAGPAAEFPDPATCSHHAT